MYHSIEAREPLLDHRIIEFTAQLPCQLKCNNNTTKYLLKSITHKYLPEKLMNRPKMGFALPIEDWFRGDLKDLFSDVLNEAGLKQSNLFHIKNTINLREKFLSNKLNYYSSKKIISIFLFQLWYKKWMG
jgi:asparagine synthase (glutamine-hydrolysing)